MVPYIYVLAYRINNDVFGSLSFADTVVWVRNDPDNDNQDGAAYDAGAGSGLVQRLRDEYGDITLENDYVIPVQLGRHQ